MGDFIKNFAVAFLAFALLGGASVAAAMLPILTLIWLEVPALPFGFPILFLSYCAALAVWFAISEYRKQPPAIGGEVA